MGACYLLSRRHEASARIFVKTGVVAGMVFSVTSLFPAGSFKSETVARVQPAKMAAMEGLFQSQERAGMAILGMPDTERGELMDPVVVPGVLGCLTYGDFRARVVGLNDIPKDQHPPIEIVYDAYHMMVGLGTMFIAMCAVAAFLLWRRRLFESRGVLWLLMLAIPFPYIANHAGWVVAEVGRQPWVVHGILRTGDGNSLNVSAGDVLHPVRLHGPVHASCAAVPVPVRAHRPAGPGPGRVGRATGPRRHRRSRGGGVLMIETLWFLVIAVLLTGDAVLDGFDLGVGTLHLGIGRTTEERSSLIDAIGPVSNGNEAWMLALGGALVAAFPHVYAASASGFYLPLMLVLWLLLLRGLGIEFRHQVDNALWRHAWDVVFSLASLLLAFLFGVALANVLRGVPLAAGGEFGGTFALLLNPFALLGGLLSVAVLALHGAAWIALKTEHMVQARARRIAPVLWHVTLVLLVAPPRLPAASTRRWASTCSGWRSW